MRKRRANSSVNVSSASTSRSTSISSVLVRESLRSVSVLPSVMAVRTRACCIRGSFSAPLTRPCRNIAEQLIEKGLATAVRHKRDDEDRSPEYDKLMAAEQA